MSQYTQDRLIATLRAERDAANARAEALLAALEEITQVMELCNPDRPSLRIARAAIAAAKEARG